MFGEECMMGRSLCTIDPKGRVNISRSITNVEVNERLAIAVKKQYLEILRAELISEKYNQLLTSLDQASNLDEYNKIEQEINNLLFSIVGCSTTDKQHRITIPDMVLSEVNLSKGSKVLCVGRGRSLCLFNPQTFANILPVSPSSIEITPKK